MELSPVLGTSSSSLSESDGAWVGACVGPDCLKGIVGRTIRTCSQCGASEVLEENAGHKVGTLVAHKDATCTEDGSESYWCSICHSMVTETIKALGHDWEEVNVIPATCATGKESGTIHEFECTRRLAVSNSEFQARPIHTHGKAMKARPGQFPTKWQPPGWQLLRAFLRPPFAPWTCSPSVRTPSSYMAIPSHDAGNTSVSKYPRCALSQSIMNCAPKRRLPLRIFSWAIITPPPGIKSTDFPKINIFTVYVAQSGQAQNARAAGPKRRAGKAVSVHFSGRIWKTIGYKKPRPANA